MSDVLFLMAACAAGFRRDLLLRQPLVDNKESPRVFAPDPIPGGRLSGEDRGRPGRIVVGLSRTVDQCCQLPCRVHCGPDRGGPVEQNMHLTPDQIVYWQSGFFKLNATIVFTWVLMVVLTVASILMTRKLSTDSKRSKAQNLLEIAVTGIESQIKEVGLGEPRRYLAFLGTLFLFVASACLATLIPGFEPPTASLSTTAALAVCVLVAVPVFGILNQGWGGYLKTYVEPTPIMLPFNLISELSRTLALAIRLFGNMMSGTMIIAILLTITPLLFPIVMTVLGLLTGMVQAYIFSILAAVYIAAATQASQSKKK